MVATVIVVPDEVIDLSFKVAGQIVVLQQDAVLERLMPTFDFALRHRMVRRASDMLHVMLRHPIRKIAGDIA